MPSRLPNLFNFSGKSPCKKFWDHLGKREKLDLRSTKEIRSDRWMGDKLVSYLGSMNPSLSTFLKYVFMNYVIAILSYPSCTLKYSSEVRAVV